MSYQFFGDHFSPYSVVQRLCYILVGVIKILVGVYIYIVLLVVRLIDRISVRNLLVWVLFIVDTLNPSSA